MLPRLLETKVDSLLSHILILTLLTKKFLPNTPKEWEVGTAVKFCIIKHFQNR